MMGKPLRRLYRTTSNRHNRYFPLGRVLIYAFFSMESTRISIHAHTQRYPFSIAYVKNKCAFAFYASGNILKIAVQRNKMYLHLSVCVRKDFSVCASVCVCVCAFVCIPIKLPNVKSKSNGHKQNSICLLSHSGHTSKEYTKVLCHNLKIFIKYIFK